MSGLGAMRSLDQQLLTRAAAVNTTLTAAGAGDNTEFNGLTLSLVTAAMLNARPQSVAFLIYAKAVLTAAKKLSIETTLQYSVDGGSNWLDVTVANGCAVNKANIAHATVLISAGGGTVHGCLKVGLDLTRIPSTANAIRIQILPDLDAGATDTAVVNAIAAFGGHQNPPQASADEVTSE